MLFQNQNPFIVFVQSSTTKFVLAALKTVQKRKQQQQKFKFKKCKRH